MISIKFKADGQCLERTDKLNLVSFARNELYAEFELGSQWQDKEPVVAQFGNRNKVYDIFVENGKCIIPWEVLQERGVLSVALFGGDLLSTNTVKISILSSGAIGGLVPTKASPSVYTYLTDLAESMEQKVNEIAEGDFNGKEIRADKIIFCEDDDGNIGFIEIGDKTGIRILNNVDKNSDWFIRIGDGEPAEEVKNGIQFENTGEFIVKNEKADIIRLTQKKGAENIIKGNETLKIVSDDSYISFDSESAGITYTEAEWNDNFKQLNINTEKGVNIQANNNSYFQSGEKKLVIGNDFNTVEFRTDGVAKFKNTVNAKDYLVNGTPIMDNVDKRISEAIEENNKMTWEKVQKIIRLGHGSQVFPVGTQLKCSHNDYGEIVWDVVAHNNNSDPAGTYQYSMTLYTHNVIDKFAFDSAEALYYCETELSAGTYNFTLPAGFYEDKGGGKTYQFTITQNIPPGGIIMFPWDTTNKNAADTAIRTYSSNSDTAAVESVSVTEGSSGTNLGAADGTVSNMNYIARASAGSSNWKESNIRCILNSDKAKADMVYSQTKFDRPPSTLMNGFMYGLDSDFLNVVGEVDNITTTNSIYETDGNVNSFYVTRDKFWLPSVTEIFGIKEGSGDADVLQGTQFDYFKDLINSDRIKYKDNIALSYTLRSTDTQSCRSFRVVTAEGSLASYGAAFNNGGLAVACAIY